MRACRGPVRGSIQVAVLEVFAILIIIGCVLFGTFVLGATFSIAYSLVSGLIVGALARLVLPGKENISLIGTALVGIAGGAIGGVVGRAIRAGTVVELIISVAVAVGLLVVLGKRQTA